MTTTIASIWRHPIKGHGREALAQIAVTENQTLPLDRTWAVLRDGAPDPQGAWALCASFTRGANAPALMAISSRYDAQSRTITLHHPDQGTVTFDPDGDTSAFLAWAAPLIPAGGAAPVAVVRAKVQGMTDTRFPSISLCNMASLSALSEQVGQPLSEHRFRANLWLAGLPPWAEFDLVGRQLRVGTSVLTVQERITRCRATEANPETGGRDALTLQALQDGWQHRDFGVYATVTTGGALAQGDAVTVQ